MKGRMLLIATMVMTAFQASAQPAVSLVTLLAVRDANGWRIDSEVEGTGVTAAAFTPPGGTAFTVPCESGPGVVLCERVEPAPPAPGFASLAALLAEYPAGSWSLSVNGGVRTAALPFDPQQPDGVVTVTNPANGAMNVTSTPGVAYENACTSCGFLLFMIEDAATLGLVTEIEGMVIGQPPLPPGQIDFAEFFDAAPTPLANGTYRLIAGAALGALEVLSFGQGGGFQYGSGANLETATFFSVPEPGGGAFAATVALLGLARRRRGAAMGASSRAGAQNRAIS
ncbi:MAG: hypothetical protein NTZ61_08605 [Proteobacteria bacterium]|nr:hypothetical protein [Pseudomonadota bacterium]